MKLNNERSIELLRDSLVASRRVIKWGYARHFDGPDASQCDTVASHSAVVAILADILANQHYETFKRTTGVELNLTNVLRMATFHDYGEVRSGDTGAASHATRGVCDLFNQERDGLEACMQGLVLGQSVMDLFDEYRKYSTPEAIFVHVADNIEGLHAGLKWRGESAEMAIGILGDNIALYRGKKDAIPTLGPVCDYAVKQILQPMVHALGTVYPEYEARLHKAFV